MLMDCLKICGVQKIDKFLKMLYDFFILNINPSCIYNYTTQI